MSLEQELKAALGRKEPSSDFAGRVLAQARHENRVVVLTPRRRWYWWGGAAATAAALVLTATTEIRHRQEEQAGRQAVLALRITAEKLSTTRNKVLRHYGINPAADEHVIKEN